MGQITNNLNASASTNPNALKSIEDFRLTYEYNKRSPEQKLLLDNWYN
jgi:hypothetical protein